MSDLPRSSAGVDPAVPAGPAELRTFARNSPWLLIALLLHALVVTILSVVFIRSQRSQPDAPPLTVAVQRAASVVPPEAEEPPLLLPHDRAPVLPAERAFELEETLLPESAAVGELTDETDTALDPGHFNPDPDALTNLPSGAPGGTPIGVAGPGHHSLGTSPFSSRVAGKNGPGHGGPGGRGPGTDGDATSESAVAAALDWLERHQSPEGTWDCDGFTARCSDEGCTGAGSSAHDAGVTGLALLAFLGAGHTHAEGEHRNTVRKGLVWLMEAQDEQGCIGPRIGQGFLYDHACATLALAEAYGMTRAKPFREPAQRAIAFVLSAQNPYSAWRYAAPGDGDDDTSVTGWMVMALKSAKLAGLVIDDTAFDGALAWLDGVTDRATGRTGYTELGGPSSRLASVAARFPPERGEAMTAVGVLARIFGGRTSASDPLIQLGAERLAQRLPEWREDTGDIDFYYWYYGTLALHQLGGARWQRWNEAIRSAVLEHQRREPESCARGSWEPLDPWSSVGGRVYATALNCLSMEVYYRYPRVFGVK